MSRVCPSLCASVICRFRTRPPSCSARSAGGAVDQELADQSSWSSSRPLTSLTRRSLWSESRRVVLAVLFLRYVVFEDPEISKRVDAERRQKRKRARSRSLGGGGENGFDRSSRGEMDPRRSAGTKDKGRGTVSYYVRAKRQGELGMLTLLHLNLGRHFDARRSRFRHRRLDSARNSRLRHLVARARIARLAQHPPRPTDRLVPLARGLSQRRRRPHFTRGSAEPEYARGRGGRAGAGAGDDRVGLY